MSNPAILELDDVRKDFERGAQRTTALNHLSLTVRRGEYRCIVGRSGAGKSTTINLILGLTAPTSGRIRVLGLDPAVDFDQLRGRIGCVFQSDRLMPWRTAIDNVRLPLEIMGRDEATLATGPGEWLRHLGLVDHQLAYPHELSGGMRQRVAIARALVSDPEVILADEPFASLDALTAEQLRGDFRDLVRRGGKTVIHITHSVHEAIELADRIDVLGGPGRLVRSIDVEADARRDPERRRQLEVAIMAAMGPAPGGQTPVREAEAA